MLGTQHAMNSADLATERMFRAVVDAALTAILVVDRVGRIVLANPATATVFGYDPEELVGEALERLLPDRIRRDHHPLFDQFMAAPEVRPIGCGRDLTARHKDGHEVPVEIALTPIEADGGAHVLAMVTDITVRQRAENQQALLAAIVNSSDNAIIGKSLDGIVTSWNPAAEAMLGWSAAEMLGQSILRVIPPDRHHEETENPGEHPRGPQRPAHGHAAAAPRRLDHAGVADDLADPRPPRPGGRRLQDHARHLRPPARRAGAAPVQ